MLSKKDVAVAVAKRTGTSNKKASEVVDATLDTIVGALGRGEEVRLSGFGAFRIAERKARTARNPRTGQRINVAASKRPAFSAGSRLTAAVKGGK